jgi:hypothetical protein
MPLYGNQSIRPGNSVTWETWVVVRKTDLPERLKHSEGDFGTYAEALEKVRHLRSIGTPGPFGIRHEMTIRHCDPAEWLEETLVPRKEREAGAGTANGQ